MSYAAGNRQIFIRDFRRVIFDENPVGNASDFRRASDRKSQVGSCGADFSDGNRKRAKKYSSVSGFDCCVRSTNTSPMRSMDQVATFLMLHYCCWCLMPHNIVLAVDPN